jgi:hypothetical protein
MRMWRKFGTDCGICLAACPFSRGVDPELVGAMKDDDAVIREILARAGAHTTRP